MKRIVKIAAQVIAVLFISSCAEQLMSPEVEPSVQVGENEVTLVADLGDGQQTKTVYNSDQGKIYWRQAEELSLFYSPDEHGGSKFTSTNTAETRVANFTGSISVITAGNDVSVENTYFVGVYPYRDDSAYDSGGTVMTTLPFEQTAAAGSFADNLYITAGRSRGLSMGFKAVCSALVFSVTSEGISSVELRGNHFEPICGTFSFKFNEENVPEVNGYALADDSYAITLHAPAGGTFEPGKDYYIITLPTEFSQGMKMTFYKKDGSYGVRTWDKKITFGRNVFSHAADADQGVVFSQAVDLGLSVNWAPFNLGAESVTDGGDYFAWGATEPMTSFIETYSGPQMGALDAAHDAANAIWGETWMMPTWDNWADLIDCCTWQYQSDYQGSGVSGYLVTSALEGYEGNSIFLPCAGNYGLDSVGGYYWISTMRPYTDYPWYFIMTNSQHLTNSGIMPAVGMSIRPVQPIEAEQVLVAGTGEMMAEASVRRNKSLTLEAEFVPSRTFDKSLTWYVANKSILSIESTEGTSATVKGRSVGRTKVMAYTTNGLFAEWNVEVLPEIAIMPNFISGQGDVWDSTATELYYFNHWTSAEELNSN